MLSAAELRRVDAIRHQLRVVSADAPDDQDFLREVLGELRSLMHTEQTLAYGLAEVDDSRHTLAFAAGSGLDVDRFERCMESLLAGAPVRWSLFNPACPEPAQRNRVLAWTRDDVHELAESGRSPIARDYHRFGTEDRAQARVLVCEGPSLLAWVGAWQPAPFDARQLSILRLVVPELKRRLAVERLLADGRRAPLLGAALDAIAATAFVVSATGHVLYANAAARCALDDEGAASRDCLVRAVSRRSEDPRWVVTPVSVRGSAPLFVLTSRARCVNRAVALDDAATAWQLTRRQRDVLEKLAEGNANRTIGAMLGISVRTVEIHVTALLEKAQVENRAELVAKVHSF